MRIRRTIPAIAGIATVALTGTACGPTAGQGGGDGGEDSIVIGTKYDQPGLGLLEGDAPVGFDVDVATYIAEELGYSEDRIEWTESASANRETYLQQGTVDMIVATYSITEERDEVVDFAGPYYVAEQDILVSADNDSVQGPEDLEGRTLCSASGSRSAYTITDTLEIDAELREAGNYSECMQLLSDGTVDAVTTDNAILAGYSAQQPGEFQVVGNPFQEERYGVGLPDGSTERCEEINAAITRMWEDGTATDLLEKHFGDAGFDYATEQPELDGCA